MTPQLYDNTVLFSTVPGNLVVLCRQGDGIVWALDAATGKTKWKFNTISDGAKLFGNPRSTAGAASGIRLRWTARVASSSRSPILAPLYGTPKFPGGSSRPGPNLYTNSIVALDGQTGKLLWYHQALPHDVRDYDLMIPAILTTVPIQGVQTEVVLVAGKMGKAFAYRADNGKLLWTRSVGRHLHDTGPLPRKPESDLPGRPRRSRDADGARGKPPVRSLARPCGRRQRDRAEGRLQFPRRPGRPGRHRRRQRQGRSGSTSLPSMDFGAATVANDVVFTSDYAGTIYAFDTHTGKTLWTTKAPAGINSFPSIDGDTLLVGAGATGFVKKPQFQLIAYSLP